MIDMTTWQDEISEALKSNGENWGDVEETTLTCAELHVKFDPGYGGTRGKPFWLWTDKNVYFAACYDGSEWVESVPRHPNPVEATKPAHIGGG